VVFCGRSAAPGRALAETLSADLGVTVHFVAADVTLAEDVTRLVEATLARLGRIDVLVNNAAAPPPDVAVEAIDAARVTWPRCSAARS
jgi:NAD(P)-dependent dehydrogenase (short-subunit alcohol dehydrogenase family)